MITPELFALFNLCLYGLVLVAILVMEHRDRRWFYRWHRNVRTRRLSTEEVMRMIEKATKRPG